MRKAMLRSIARCFAQAHAITFTAAAVDVLRYCAHKGSQAIFSVQNQFQPDGFGIVDQRSAAAAVFRIGMNVGIFPETNRLNFLFTQGFNAHDGARRTADMQ